MFYWSDLGSTQQLRVDMSIIRYFAKKLCSFCQKQYLKIRWKIRRGGYKTIFGVFYFKSLAKSMNSGKKYGERDSFSCF